MKFISDAKDMQTTFLVCNLPKRLGGSSIPELRDMCRSRKIRRQKSNNFLKTKRDMCLALTLDGSAAFQERMNRSQILRHEFGITNKKEMPPEIVKEDITTQLNESLERNAKGLQMVKQLANEASAQTKKVIDDHHDLLKENATFDESSEDHETVNLRNRYLSQLEFLEQKANSLKEKEREIDDLYATLKANNVGLVAQKKDIISRPVNDLDIITADLQQMRMNEREILLSLAEIKDHIFRVRTEAQRDPAQSKMSVSLTDDLKNLQDIKDELEKANKALKTQLSQKESALNAEHKTEVEKYNTLAKSKEDELLKAATELQALKKEITECHTGTNKLKTDLKSAKLDLSKYTDLFPSIEDATAVFNQRKELENRAQKAKNNLRSNEVILAKLIDKLDKLDDDTTALDRDFAAEPNNISSVIRRVDKVLDRYSDMKREMGSLQRQIKASDAKVRDFQSDYLQLLKITDEKLDNASTTFTDRKDIFDKIKNFMTNNQYLSKALGDLRSDKDKIKSKIDRVSERMQQIGTLLDDAEKEESTLQTGGADQQMDVDRVMATLDGFETRIKLLIDKRSGLVKQIQDLKSTVKSLNEELTKTTERSTQDLQKRAGDLSKELDVQRKEFQKVHDRLKKALSDLEASDESNDKKYLQLKATVQDLLGVQSSVLQDIANVQVKLSHTDALKTATKLDAAETIVQDQPIPSEPSLPEHESRLAQVKQALRDSVVSRQEQIDEINKHEQTLESLEDARLQNSDDKTEVKRLEAQIQDISRQKAKAEESFRDLEKDIAEKVAVIDKLQNQLLAVQQQDTEKLEEIKSALEEAYMTQIHAKDDSLQRLSDQLRTQETADRDALRAQEQALRNESSTRLKDYIQQVEFYKQKADSEQDRDTAVLLKEKEENLEHEKLIHEQFNKALAAKDAEINQLQTSLQQRLKDVSDTYDSKSASDEDRKSSDDSDVKRQSEYLKNVKDITESWQERYDKIREDYEKINRRYKEDLNTANDRALKLETDLRDKTLEIEAAEANAKTMAERINRLSNQHEEVSSIAKGLHDELIQAQLNLNKELLHKEDKRTLDEILEDNRNLSRDKLRFEEELKTAENEKGVYRETIDNLRRDKLILEKNGIAVTEAESKEKAAVAQRESFKKLYEDTKSKAIKYAETTNALQSRLDEIREAVKEFGGLKMLNTKDVHNISSPGEKGDLGLAVQAVKDIVQDYRYFRADYDKVVGKMRDNIVSIVKSLTDGRDTIDLAAIDKKAAAIMSTEDAKAELQRYKTLLYDELKKEADMKYKQALLTAKAYGVEDKFHKETEADLYKIFESSRSPEYYKKRIDILNSFIAYITQTRQRIRARASSILKGDDDQKQRIVNLLKDIVEKDIDGINSALIDLKDNIPKARDVGSIFKRRLKYLIETINKINDLKPETVFDSSALQTKAVIDWEQSRRRYVEDVNNAVTFLVGRAGLKQGDLSERALGAVEAEAPDSVDVAYRITPQDRMIGGASNPDQDTFFLQRVKAAGSEYDKLTRFFIAQWEETNDRPPDLSSYQKSLMSVFSTDKQNSSEKPGTNQPNVPQPGSPSPKSSRTPSASDVLTMRKFSRYFLKYFDGGSNLELWPHKSADGNEDIRYFDLVRKARSRGPSGNLSDAEHVKVFDHIFAFAINAHMQRYLYDTSNFSGMWERLARRYYEPIKDIISRSIEDTSTNLDLPDARGIDDTLDGIEHRSSLNNNDDYNRVLDQFIAFRNKIKQQQRGGSRMSHTQELRDVIASLSTLNEQKEQSRKYLLNLLKSIERDLVTMMKMRPQRHGQNDRTTKKIIVGGAADDVINVKTIQPYDVDKLNEVLEGLNKMIQTQMKEMRSLKTSSREGKEWKDNFEKLDRKLVEKDVYIEQMQEIVEQSVDRALTLEEELIKRDGAFDRLKLVVLGLRVRSDGSTYFDRSRNAFKSVKNPDGTVKYPEFVWDLSVTDKGNEVKRSDSMRQLKSWFESVKSRISVQMIFDIFDDAMTYQHYMGDQNSFNTENSLLDTVLGLQAEIEKTVRQLNGSPYDNVYATIDDLRMLNDRWYNDIISAQAREGLTDFQSHVRATLFGTKPNKFSRKDFQRTVIRLSQIAKDNILKIQIALTNTPDHYWDDFGELKRLIETVYIPRGGRQSDMIKEAMNGTLPDDSVYAHIDISGNDKLFRKSFFDTAKASIENRWGEDEQKFNTLIDSHFDWITAKNTFQTVTAALVSKMLPQMTKTSLHYTEKSDGKNLFSHARLASLKTQQFIADKGTFYNHTNDNLRLPDDNQDGNALKIGFFTEFDDETKKYPDYRVDAWYVSTKKEPEINQYGQYRRQQNVSADVSELLHARTELFWKVSSQIGMIVDVLNFIEPGTNGNPGINIVYHEACAALRSIACVFMIRDLYEMSAIMLTSSQPDVVIDTLEGGSEYKAFRGFSAIVKAMYLYLQSALSSASEQSNGRRLAALLDLINQVKSLQAECEVIDNSLNATVIGSDHRSALLLQQVRRLHHHLETDVKASFDNYLSTFVANRTVTGGALKDEIDVHPSKTEGFVRGAFGTLIDQIEGLVPRSLIDSLTGSKPDPEISPLTDLDEPDMSTTEMRNALDGLDTQGIEDKLIQIKDLRAQLDEKKKGELPEFAIKTLDSIDAELNMTEVYLQDKKSSQEEEHKLLDAQAAQLKDQRDQIRRSDDEITQLRRQVAMEAMKSSKPIKGRVLYACLKPGALQILEKGWPDQTASSKTTEQSSSAAFSPTRNDHVEIGEVDVSASASNPTPAETDSPSDVSENQEVSDTEQELPSTSDFVPIDQYVQPQSIEAENKDIIEPTNTSILLGENESANAKNDIVLIGDLSSSKPNPKDLLNSIEKRLEMGDYDGIPTDFDRLDTLDLNNDEAMTVITLKNKFNKAMTASSEVSTADAAGDIIRRAADIKQQLDDIETQIISRAFDTDWVHSQQDAMRDISINIDDLKTVAEHISNESDIMAAGAIQAVDTQFDQVRTKLENTAHEAQRYVTAKTQYKQLFQTLQEELTSSSSDDDLSSFSERLADLKDKYDGLTSRSGLNGQISNNDLREFNPSTLVAVLTERLKAKKILEESRSIGKETLQKLRLICQNAIEVGLDSTPFDNLINMLSSVVAGDDPMNISTTVRDIEKKLTDLQSSVESARKNKENQNNLVVEISNRSKQLNDISSNIARLNRQGDDIVSRLRTVGKRADAARQISGLITELNKKVSSIMTAVKSLKSLSELEKIDRDIAKVREEDIKHAEEAMNRLQQLVAEEKSGRKDLDDRWDVLINKDYSSKPPRKAMMDSLREVRSQITSKQKQEGGDISHDWTDRINGMRLSALDLYTYLIEFFRRPSILRLISSRNFSMELSAAHASPADIKSFLSLLFVDVSSLPAQDTSKDLSTSEKFWNLVTRDTGTYRLQATAAGLDHDKDQVYVRADEYFKFIFWLLTARKKAIASDPEEHQDLLVHIDLNIDMYTSWIEQDAMHSLESRLKLPKIDARHVETGVSQVLTYLKVRCDNPQYWNERFRLSYNKDTKHEVFVEYNNHRFPYYIHTEVDQTYKEVDPDARKAFGEYAGTATNALSKAAPYQYDYLMGPFTRVFTPDKTAKDMAVDCIAIKNTLIMGQSVFILGYGASGAGKTSTLICRSGSKDCGAADSGVLLNLLQDDGLAGQFPNVELTVHELFANHDNPRMGSGLQNTKKIDDMRFAYKNGTYRYDVSSGYQHHTNIHSDPITGGRVPGVRRYGMPSAGDEYYKDRYVNVVNTSLFDETHDLKLDGNTTLSRVIKQALDDDRLSRATTNNPNSSRSHVLIMIKMIDALPGDSQDRPYLIVGDFAGVENEFACDDLDTLLKMYNRKDTQNRRLYTQNIIDEDVASADDPDKFLKKGGAEDFKTYADTPDIDLSQETNIVKEKLKAAGTVKCKGLESKANSILETFRKVAPFTLEKNTILSLLPLENDMYVNGLLPSSLAKIDNLVKRTIRLVSALIGENYLDDFYKVLSDVYPESKVGNPDAPVANRLNQKANDLFKKGLFRTKPISSLFGFSPVGFGESNLYSTSKPNEKSAPHQIRKMRERLTPFFEAFGGKTNRTSTCVEAFLTAVYDSHVGHLENRASAISNAVAVCKSRTFEGIYINDSLAVVREVLKDLILYQAKDTSRLKITPPFPDLCLPIYCNPLVESCFGSDTTADDGSKTTIDLKKASSSLMGIIFDAVGEKAKDLKIVVFCVFLMNRTNNDPPPTAFIDGEDLRLEISRLDNRASLLATLATNVPEEAVTLKDIADFFNADADSPMKQEVVNDLHNSVESQRSLLGDGLCDDILTRLGHGEWATVMKMIDRANATHPMGTLFFTDSMAKYSLTEFSCRITSDSKIPFTREMTRSARFNMNSAFDDSSAMVNMMNEKDRLQYIEPKDPAATHPPQTRNVPVDNDLITPAGNSTQIVPKTKIAITQKTPIPANKPIKKIVGKVPSTSKNKAKTGGGSEAVFNPATFDQMIEQWPEADGRAFSDFLVDAHKQKHLLVKRRGNRSPRKPRRMTRK